MTTLYSGTMQVPERHRFDVGVLQAYLRTRLPDFAGPLRSSSSRAASRTRPIG